MKTAAHLDGHPSQFTHVAFAVERGFIDDVKRVFESAGRGVEPPLGEILSKWWSARSVRLERATTDLLATERRELQVALADEAELLAILARAPELVRRVALTQSARSAARLGGLAALGVPGVMLDLERRRCAEQLTALDPALPWQDESCRVFDAALDHGVEEGRAFGDELHVWLDAMLKAAQADAPNLGLGDAFHHTPEATRFLAREPRARARVASPWPGFELTTMSVDPDLAAWLSPRIALPGRLEVPTPAGPRLVVAESSGPVSYAGASDELPRELDAALCEQVRALSGGCALVSFVWLETETAGPWRPY